MEKEGPRIQYHPAFCAAVEQIFEHDSCEYTYDEEYSLNTLPNRIDLLVTKKGSQKPKTGLGKIFKKYNLFEYKSPGQSLGVKEYEKAMAYAYYFAGSRSGVDMEEVTISFVREGKPVKLLRYFESKGYAIKRQEKGIYHIQKAGQVDMQIVVIRELGQEYIWLKALTRKMTREEIVSLSEKMAPDGDVEEIGRITCIMDLVIMLNNNEEWKKELIGMGAFRDLFQEEFDKKEKEIQTLDKQLQNKEEQLHDKDEQLQNKEEQLQDKDEQLQSKNKQLKNKDEQLKKLRQEIVQLKKQINKIAAL